jgi:hypothetical protein
MYSSMEMKELSDDCLREKLEMRLNYLLRSDFSEVTIQLNTLL